jgi:predicted enzyme related to lactoylglutathione lyase
MTQYLISFGAHAMDRVPDEDAPAVARAARAAVQEATNASVYVSASGLEDQPASIVATGGAVTDGPYPAGHRRVHAR